MIKLCTGKRIMEKFCMKCKRHKNMNYEILSKFIEYVALIRYVHSIDYLK